MSPLCSVKSSESRLAISPEGRCDPDPTRGPVQRESSSSERFSRGDSLSFSLLALKRGRSAELRLTARAKASACALVGVPLGAVGLLGLVLDDPLPALLEDELAVTVVVTVWTATLLAPDLPQPESRAPNTLAHTSSATRV